MIKNKKLPVYNIDAFGPVGAGDFYANIFSAHLKEHHFVNTPHKHDFYLTVLFTKGSGMHEIDFTTYPVKPGSVFTLFPGQAHNWKLSDDIEGYIFFHSKNFYNLYFTYERVDHFPFFNSPRNWPVITLKGNALKTTESIFNEILNEYGDYKPMKFQKICSLVNVLYLELTRLYVPAKLQEKENRNLLYKFREAKDLIDKNFKKLKSPKEYAALMNMSEKHFNRICKTCVNKTATDLITDRVMLEAKRTLAFSKFSVAQIADQLGYSDYSYFSRLFRKKTGRTPIEFSNHLYDL